MNFRIFFASLLAIVFFLIAVLPSVKVSFSISNESGPSVAWTADAKNSSKNSSDFAKFPEVPFDSDDTDNDDVDNDLNKLNFNQQVPAHFAFIFNPAYSWLLFDQHRIPESVIQILEVKPPEFILSS